MKMKKEIAYIYNADTPEEQGVCFWFSWRWKTIKETQLCVEWRTLR